jgi:hypothetical protein
MSNIKNTANTSCCGMCECGTCSCGCAKDACHCQENNCQCGCRQPVTVE